MPTAKTKPAHHNDRLKKLAEQTIAQPQQKGFFESLFGGLQQSSPQTALAYAAPEPSVVQPSVRQMFQPNIRAGDAVYNISKHTVYMPDGSQLEAHSGLGPMLDNPNYVSQRMRGSTVPGTYNLTLREAPFHGVKALRLVPTNQQMYGRFGLLAHTFMLGPMGDSNGCVSFRNYQAFLSAYEHGQVKRLIVVPDGTGAAPAIYADMNGQSAAPMQPHRHHHKKVWHYRHSFVQTARL